ncbi:hypothetical protein JCM19231_4820 [Vibrio ishigakensis]|uniref:Flp pilus assembly protein n=1 Tax=Vibrio ishigakensis TaxID=1481914 RepID=A0A0B8NXX7_9VIBR|nr:Flp family type IVb pilin [Vibrio ishigakensis]GAM58836.1 hypothetical protein JCM19231_4820 [Vibrio ishigakensis]
MLKSLISRFVKDERGVTAIEYGVIGVAIASVLGIVMYTGGTNGGLAGEIQAAFNAMIGAFSS